MKTAGSHHDLGPKYGSCTREADGEPASLLDPNDYPVIAECRCGKRIRTASFYGDWEHLEEKTS